MYKSNKEYKTQIHPKAAISAKADHWNDHKSADQGYKREYHLLQRQKDLYPRFPDA